jgi:hypothetical protein
MLRLAVTVPCYPKLKSPDSQLPMVLKRVKRLRMTDAWYAHIRCQAMRV